MQTKIYVSGQSIQGIGAAWAAGYPVETGKYGVASQKKREHKGRFPNAVTLEAEAVIHALSELPDGSDVAVCTLSPHMANVLSHPSRQLASAIDTHSAVVVVRERLDAISQSLSAVRQKAMGVAGISHQDLAPLRIQVKMSPSARRF